jgi:probable HAF family extracellular repeat protein
LLWLLILSAGASSAQTFTGLKFLPNTTIALSKAHGVSIDGRVVVGEAGNMLGQGEGFHWTKAGGMVGLGSLPNGNLSAAYGISSDGTVVVGQNNLAGEAFRWTAGAGMIGLGDFPGGQSQSAAFAASADGTVVVGYGWSAAGVEAFRWTSSGGMVGLGDFAGGSFSSGALGVSSNGSVVVGWGTLSSPGIRAFRWTSAGGMVNLGGLPGANSISRASGVSADGNVVIGRAQGVSGQEAFRWTSASGMVGLGDLPDGDFKSESLGVSGDGSVVVGTSSTSAGYAGHEAFIWDLASGMRDLRRVLTNDFGLGAALSGWRLTAATAVSGDGTTIVGYGRKPDGNTEAWIATISLPKPMISLTVTNFQLDLSWPMLPTGWRLESHSNAFGSGNGTNWFTLLEPLLTNRVSIPIDPSQGSVFFRLRGP